jgi:hypothetical protein
MKPWVRRGSGDPCRSHADLDDDQFHCQRGGAELDDDRHFLQEVANAFIYDSAHYRTSTEVDTPMGIQIGALAAAKYLRPHEENK